MAQFSARQFHSHSTHCASVYNRFAAFARSLAPLTHSLATHSSLRSRAPLRSFVRSLAHLLTPELMGKWFLSIE